MSPSELFNHGSNILWAVLSKTESQEEQKPEVQGGNTIVYVKCGLVSVKALWLDNSLNRKNEG